MMAISNHHRTLRAVPPNEAAAPACMPKVLTRELLNKLQAANSMVRWLREYGHTPLTVDVSGDRPTILVERSAAAFLSHAGHGKTTKAGDGNVTRYGYVLIDGCEIRWNERLN